MYPFIAGWSSLVARRAHNPKVVGSNPAPATIAIIRTYIFLGVSLFYWWDTFELFFGTLFAPLAPS
jgi:hypothetical protein